MLHTGPMDEPKEPEIVSISAVIRDNLRELREEKDWSQRQVAEILTERTGETWTQTRVLDMEGGRGRDRSITSDELAILCRVYEVSLLDLLRVPDKALAQVGQSQVTAEDLFHLLGIEEDTNSHFDWQWAWFRDTTLALFLRGELTTDLLDQATGGHERYDHETGVFVAWEGPTPEETEQAREKIYDLYRESMEPDIFDEIAEDPSFWEQARGRRPRWGVSRAQDDFTELILEIIRETDRDDEKGEN